MFPESKTTATFANYTCKSFIKLTPGQSWTVCRFRGNPVRIVICTSSQWSILGELTRPKGSSLSPCCSSIAETNFGKRWGQCVSMTSSGALMILKCQLMCESLNFQEGKGWFIDHRVGLGFCFNVPQWNLPVHQTVKQAFSCLMFSLIQMIFSIVYPQESILIMTELWQTLKRQISGLISILRSSVQCLDARWVPLEVIAWRPEFTSVFPDTWHVLVQSLRRFSKRLYMLTAH